MIKDLKKYILHFTGARESEKKNCVDDIFPSGHHLSPASYTGVEENKFRNTEEEAAQDSKSDMGSK